MRPATCVLLVALSLWPLTSLFRYYDHKIAAGETNAQGLAFIDEFFQQWRGEKIFLSSSPDVPHGTEYLLAVKEAPYMRLPVGRIVERLVTGQETGRVTLILSNDDLARAQLQADLADWNSPAMQEAHRQGYGVYTVADAQQVRKPGFVLADTCTARERTCSASMALTARNIQVNLADELSMIGYEVKPDRVKPGQEFVVNIYWQARRSVPEAYIGFAHVLDPNGRIMTQDDHELGRGFYRTIFWQPGEVIREKYLLRFPPESPGGDYVLEAGAYSFPSLKRLVVRSADRSVQHDAVVLETVRVGP